MGYSNAQRKERLSPPVQRASSNRDSPLDQVDSIVAYAQLRALCMWRDAPSQGTTFAGTSQKSWFDQGLYGYRL